MTAGLNDDNREEWQIVDPDDAEGIIGWRLTLVEEMDGLVLQAYDEGDTVMDSLVVEPYLLSAYALTFKQAAYHERAGSSAVATDTSWNRVINPFDDHIEVEYYMERVEEGLYELGTREVGNGRPRIQIPAPYLKAFAETFKDVKEYYREWVLGDSDSEL
jgi:hypothetical protein